MPGTRRSDKYACPAAAPSSASPTETHAASSKKKRNPCLHHAQGFYPYVPREDPPVKKVGPIRKATFFVVVLLLLGVFIYATYQVVFYLIQSHHAKQEEQMIQTMIEQSEASPSPEATVEPSPEPTSKPSSPTRPSLAGNAASFQNNSRIYTKPDVLIQFTNALAINPDTVGQLKMGESISTYVVQRDNSYYLRRSFSGEYSISGTIFLDVTCSIYPRSRNLIIHGHNMHDGTAFGKLSRFANIDYLNKYPFIEFSTLYEAALYRPFAVVYYSVNPESEDYLDLYQINAMTDTQFDAFISKIKLLSEYHIPLSVAKTDKIITVTTCATGNDDMRFAVFAVKNNNN